MKHDPNKTLIRLLMIISLLIGALIGALLEIAISKL